MKLLSDTKKTDTAHGVQHIVCYNVPLWYVRVLIDTQKTDTAHGVHHIVCNNVRLYNHR